MIAPLRWSALAAILTLSGASHASAQQLICGPNGCSVNSNGAQVCGPNGCFPTTSGYGYSQNPMVCGPDGCYVPNAGGWNSLPGGAPGNFQLPQSQYGTPSPNMWIQPYPNPQQREILPPENFNGMNYNGPNQNGPRTLPYYDANGLGDRFDHRPGANGTNGFNGRDRQQSSPQFHHANYPYGGGSNAAPINTQFQIGNSGTRLH